MSRFSLARFAAITAIAVVALAGCGDAGGSDDDLATLGDDSAASGTTAVTSSEDAVLAYTSCLRDNGIDVDDPTVDADGNIRFGAGAAAIDTTSDEFQDANDACSDLLVGADFGIGDDQVLEARDAFQRFTTCLRDEGLDVGDFQFGDGNARRVVTAESGQEPLIEVLEPAIEGLDPNDPAHQTAVDTCEPQLREGLESVATGGGS